ncbi:transcription termination/antitermination factor NusG [Candidatus Dojkabacteria bacterium]|nr:transcription termination/antitermination factor NusG [Candidatus Dojkabacteria bacterium]
MAKKRVTKKSKKSAKEVLENSGESKSSTKAAKTTASEDKNDKTKSTTKTTSQRMTSKPRWYVLNIQPSHEIAVSNSIKQRVKATGTQDRIKEVLVPTQKKIVVKEGKQDIKEERIFPGYILIKMQLNPQTWELITNTEGVRGFVRTDKYPRPLPEEEVKAIMKFMEVEQPAYKASFSVGEALKIVDGPFADFIGSVQSINDKKGKVEVLVSFLGREAPVELDFSQVEKL